VVGHVEWVTFATVARLPERGEILEARNGWDAAAGGGAVAAVQLARLAGEATFFTALGGGELAERVRGSLEGFGVRVRAGEREVPQRRAFTFLDDGGERTITVIGERIVPHGDDPVDWPSLASFDGVYFTGGDADAARAARAARVLVATPRGADALAASGVQLDVLVHSAGDAAEVEAARALRPAPRLTVATRGGEGGSWVGSSSGSWKAAEVPGPVADAYGCGDSFAAGLTFGLARGDELVDALVLAARCGAVCLTGHGPYEAQLTL
jgi:ribokinase